MKPTRPLLLALLLLLASSISTSAEFDPSDVTTPADLAVQTITSTDPWTVPLMPAFTSAAKKYDVPVSLLLALGYFGSHFENRGGAPTIEGGYGVMALRDNTLGGKSLIEGAALLGTDTTTLKTSPILSIQAAAAFLDAYATEKSLDRSKGLQSWVDAVTKYAGLDVENSRYFAAEVYDKLKGGLDYTNTAGERFQFAPQDIGEVNTAAMQPPAPIVGSSDYGPAIWDPAASCNYSAYYTTKDSVVVHTIEGSAAGARSWMKNCNSSVSSHYVVSEAGTVWQMVNENYRAWHAGCYNSRGLGIEHEGYAGSSSHPTSLYDASALLVRHMCDRWGIPKAHKTYGPGILGHNDANVTCGGSHWDPGSGWNWTYFIQQVNGGTPPPPSWAATYRAQSYPSSMTAGSTAVAWVEYNNTGTGHWTHDHTRLGTSSPQDRSSPFFNSGNWVGANRPSDVDQSDVAQNQVGRFSFVLKAPSTPGTYTEKYKLVQEGVTWFGSEITWTIIVTAAKGSITGTVRNSADTQPIAGATVAIAGGATTTTNSAGVYTFTGVDAGAYTLTASKSGFNSASGPASVTASQTTTKDFSLTPTDTTVPSAPTGLSATAVSPSQINLSWTAATDNVGVTAYLVYRNGVQIGTTAATTYQDNGLAANTGYSYYVKAKDAANNLSTASNTAAATTFPGQVPIFEDGFANLGYWENLIQSPMPGEYPPLLMSDKNHATFSGGYSLKTRTSTDANQGCLIGHRFNDAFGTAKFETYFFDGGGVDYSAGFGSSTESWVSYPSAYATLSSVGGGQSANCLQASDGGWTSGVYKEITGGFAAGESYSLSMWAKWPTPSGTVYGTAPRCFVRFFDGAGTELRTDYSGNITADNAWRQYTVSGMIPAGTAKVWVGHWAILNAASPGYTYFADSVSFTSRTVGVVKNNSRQGLQVRSLDTNSGVKAIYYIGTYSAGGPAGSDENYSVGYYKVCGSGCTGWYWTYNVKPRSAGWHKLTLDFLPYSGTGDVKAYIDGTLVATLDRTADTQTYGLNMVAYGYHYRVNQESWFDDVAMYATQPHPAPTMGTPETLSTSSIRWHFMDNSSTESGFKVIDAAGQTKATAGATTGTGSFGHADEGGLVPNTAYTRIVRAYNGTLDSFDSASATKWTLSVPPGAATVTCDHAANTWSSSSTFTFTAVGGFGDGTVAGYRYAWDQSPTYTFTGAEPVWNTGDLLLTAGEGDWYLHVQGYNGEGVANGNLDLGPFRYDSIAPQNPTAATETNGSVNSEWQSSVADPAFAWSGAIDAESGIADYLVYFGADEQGTSTEAVTSPAYDPAAVDAGIYFLRVCARDAAGNEAGEWATLFVFKYDASGGDAPTVTDDGAYTGSKTKLHAEWYSADTDSGIAEYQYAVGSSSGAEDVVAFTSVGTDTEAVITIPAPGLSLGTTYYISVKAKNGAGAWSGIGSSDGIEVAPEVATISDAKRLANDIPVALVNKIVVAGSEGSYYIEEQDRFSGILVKGPLPNGAGDGALVTVGGTMGISSDERAILSPATVLEAGPDEARMPRPLFMLGRNLGGAAFSSATPGVTDGFGLNNIGLFAKVCGWYSAGGEHDFYVSDGSPSPVKVVAYGLDLSGFTSSDYVIVTGIVSLEMDGTTLKPVIRVLSSGSVLKAN